MGSRSPLEKGALPLVVAASGGDAWWFLGILAIIRVSGEQTGGRYALFEGLLPKDAAPPLHSHAQDESFVLLDGRMDIWVGGPPRKLGPGSVAFAPGGTPHTFLVLSETARVLFLSTPAGIEQMIPALGVPAPQRELPPDDLYPPREQIEAAFKKCGIVTHGPAPTPI